MTKISVIIPVYNVENYIQKTFDSVLDQSIGFKNIEVIFVDDCSTDKSGKIIDELSTKHDNVTSIHLEENSGAAGKPRNIGLDNATGKYVLFLDSDDYLVYNACEKLLKYSGDESDIFIGGYANKNKNHEDVFINQGKKEKTIYQDPKNNIELFKINPAISAKLFKRNFLIENNIYFPIGIPGQDLVFLTNAISKSSSVTVINDFLVYYRIIRSKVGDQSISHNVTPKYLKGLLKAYSMVLDVVEENNVSSFTINLMITNHFDYFLKKINQSYLTKEELNEIFNSEEFTEFKNKNFFKRENVEWKAIFNNIEEDSIYTEKLIKIIKSNNNNEIKIKELEKEVKYQKNLPKKITNSTSWKITKPLRKINNIRGSKNG